MKLTILLLIAAWILAGAAPGLQSQDPCIESCPALETCDSTAMEWEVTCFAKKAGLGEAECVGTCDPCELNVIYNYTGSSAWNVTLTTSSGSNSQNGTGPTSGAARLLPDCLETAAVCGTSPEGVMTATLFCGCI